MSATSLLLLLGCGPNAEAAKLVHAEPAACPIIVAAERVQGVSSCVPPCCGS